MDIALIMQIVEMILQMIQDCPTRNAQQVSTEIRSPGRFTKLRLYRLAKAKGLDVTKDQIDEVCGYGADLSQAEIQQLLADAWGMF